MSHFPAAQPYSLIPSALRPTITINLESAVRGVNYYTAYYTTLVDMKVSGDTLLFTTEAGRGYFVPLYINAVCCSTYNPSTTATAPNLSVGFESGNAYRNFVNQRGLENGGDIWTGQWEKGDPTTPSNNYDIFGVELAMDQYGRACPPSTGVYARIGPASSATNDQRIVTVFGVYIP